MPADRNGPTKPKKSGKAHKQHMCRNPDCGLPVKGHPPTGCPVITGYDRRFDHNNRKSTTWLQHDGKDKKAVPRKPSILKGSKKLPSSSTAASDQSEGFLISTPDDFGRDSGPSHAATIDGQGLEGLPYQGHDEGSVQSHPRLMSPGLGYNFGDHALGNVGNNNLHTLGPHQHFYAGDLGINGTSINSTGRQRAESSTSYDNSIPITSMMNPHDGEGAPLDALCTLDALEIPLPHDILHYQSQGIYGRTDPLVGGGNGVLNHNGFLGPHKGGLIQFPENFDASNYGQTYQAQGTDLSRGHDLSSSFVQGPQEVYATFGGGQSNRFFNPTLGSNNGHINGSEYPGLIVNNIQMTPNIGRRDSMYEGYPSSTPESCYADALTPGTDGGPQTPYTSRMHNVTLPDVGSSTQSYHHPIYSSPLRHPSKGSSLWEGSYMSPGVDHPTVFDARFPQSQYYGA